MIKQSHVLDLINYLLVAGSGISTTGISSTTVKQTSIWKPNLSGLYLFMEGTLPSLPPTPPPPPPPPLRETDTGQENL